MSQKYLMSRDLELLESGVLADATITCGDKTWKVHKNIIRRCDWFNKAFSGNFKEAQTNNVNISAEDFSPEVVDCAISFIYSGVVNIEKANTNDSVPDACVRLWAIADFWVLKELENEVLTILDNYCDERVKAICAMDKNHRPSLTPHDYDILLVQTFRGVETAYTTYPHSVPCQQVLVSFFHGIRLIVFAKQAFLRAMSEAPPQFSHELFLATIGGRESKWAHQTVSAFNLYRRTGGCTYCKARKRKHPESYVVDPSMSEQYIIDKARNFLWRCSACFEKHGFKHVGQDDERL